MPIFSTELTIFLGYTNYTSIKKGIVTLVCHNPRPVTFDQSMALQVPSSGMDHLYAKLLKSIFIFGHTA
ncbi:MULTISPECIES: hypothetical protein [unclassified Enterococcus]|uniref:hypothetical protein n=1 Tax=unclassified Enterococcus TaxID=2608891 RepID=UPI0013EE1BB4|nr:MULTISPECIES: hypothetical protein [unclassified Enterococcus]